MNIVTVLAGVLIGNFITFMLIWQIRKLDVPNPPIKSLLAVIFIGVWIALIGFAFSQSLQEEVSALRP